MATENSAAPSIINIVNDILLHAWRNNASDIHCEPRRDGYSIRLRINGLLSPYTTLTHTQAAAVCSRIKVLAHLNISERRIPQDGKIVFPIDHATIDLRVATFPTPFGEKIVIRLLDRSPGNSTLRQLGLSTAMHTKLLHLMNKPAGFILIAGPTGCGKTTTVYAALNSLKSTDKHIITLEDPIEYYIDGITQGHVQHGIGFTFEKGMRAMLRQDPDIIMIGEIRDRETARIALQAALTGHLVFSTVHTADAMSAFIRLVDMDIEPFLLHAAISGIVAQQLLNRICDGCKTPYQPHDQERELCMQLTIPLTNAYTGIGCTTCNNTGYKGRVGLFELFPITEDVRGLLRTKPTSANVRTFATQHGFISFAQDGAQKIEQGLITVADLLKAIA